MNNERHTDGLETAVGEIRPAFGCRGRQFVTEHVRKAHAGLLKNCAVAEDATQTTTATRSLPGIAPEFGFAIKLLEFRDDAALQRLQIVFYLFKFVHGVRGRSTFPVASSRISDGPEVFPQSPGTM